MSGTIYWVRCRWDEEARVWYVEDSNVPGLATEADTPEAMEAKLDVMIPELLEAQEPRPSREPMPVELVWSKTHTVSLQAA